jgi:hypothetical protein
MEVSRAGMKGLLKVAVSAVPKAALLVDEMAAN